MVKELAAFEREPDGVVATEDSMRRDGFSSIAPWFHAVVWEAPLSSVVATEATDAAPASGHAAAPAAAASASAPPSPVKWVPAAFALCHASYSTWEGRTLYLEDLYVRPAWRGRGIATSLLAVCAAAAAESGCARLQWTVLSWNDVAISLYQSSAVAATPMAEWRIFRLYRADMHRVAALLVGGAEAGGPAGARVDDAADAAGQTSREGVGGVSVAGSMAAAAAGHARAMDAGCTAAASTSIARE